MVMVKLHTKCALKKRQYVNLILNEIVPMSSPETKSYEIANPKIHKIPCEPTIQAV